MLLLRRLIPLITSLTLITIFELFFFIPEFFPLWILLLLGTLIGAIVVLMGTGLATPWSRLRFLVAPVILIASAAAFILFVSQGIAPHLIALSITMLVFLYLEHMFLYIWIHEHYAPFSLEYTTGAIALVSIFFTTSSLLASHALLGVATLFLLPVIITISFAIYTYVLWMNKFPLRSNLPLLLAMTIITTELFWAVSTLPLHFAILGCLITLAAYTMLEISRAYLLKTLNKKTLQHLLIFSGTLVVLLLITARWQL